MYTENVLRKRRKLVKNETQRDIEKQINKTRYPSKKQKKGKNCERNKKKQ